jgi:hypothetical protein
VRKEVVLAEELRGLDDGELNIRLSGAPNPTVDRLLIRVVLPLEKKSTNLLITNGALSSVYAVPTTRKRTAF